MRSSLFGALENVHKRVILFSAGGKKVRPSDNNFRIHNGLVTVKSVPGRNLGSFVCIATNALGRIEKSIKVSLSGEMLDRVYSYLTIYNYLVERLPIWSLKLSGERLEGTRIDD